MSSHSPDHFFLTSGTTSTTAPGAHEDHNLLLHHPNNNHHLIYHVPQHSRKEKLRFPSDRSSPPLPPAPPTSLLLLHNTSNDELPTPPIYQHNSLPSSSLYLSQYPSYGFPADSLPSAEVSMNDHHRIASQGFNLSLSSAAAAPSSSSRQQLWNRLTPLGPFTGYAAVLSRSRFVEPARRILEEVCDVGQPRCAESDVIRAEDMMLDDSDPADVLEEISRGRSDAQTIMSSDQQWRRTRLISMLDEVYKRYKQFCQQLQAVITSFGSVAGLSSAAPYAFTVLKAMTKHFRCVKNMIVAQLRQSNKFIGKEGLSKEEVATFGILDGNCVQRVSNNIGTCSQPHVWRPQRGLPERAVAVLRAWLFEHFLHPYPTDPDKQMLAKQTGLTRNQVSNWFINARVRLWKPMVEEIHSLEMRQKNKTLPADNDRNTSEQAQIPSSSNVPLYSYQQPEITNMVKEPGLMTRNIEKELSNIPSGLHEPVNYEYGGFSNPHHVGSELGGFSSGNNSGVSLTLGLQQNNGICFSDQFPPNVARRFGLDDCSDTYMVSSFGIQDRQFSKDVVGSRLLHDFVG